MKLIDDKGKICGKISIVDLFAVVLMLACVAAVGLKLHKAQTIHGGDCTIEYSIRIENIRDMSVNAIKQELKDVTDAETGYKLGDITDVQAKPAMVLVQTNDGNFSLKEYENRYDAVITFRTDGSETDDGYYASSGRQLVVGDTIGVINGYAQFFGEVISVKTL